MKWQRGSKDFKFTATNCLHGGRKEEGERGGEGGKREGRGREGKREGERGEGRGREGEEGNREGEGWSCRLANLGVTLTLFNITSLCRSGACNSL